MERIRKKSDAIYIESNDNTIPRLRKENRRLIRERDDLSADNDCLAKDNVLLAKSNRCLQEEITRLKGKCERPSPLAKQETDQNSILKDERDAAQEDYLKMKNETLPELRRQIHRLTQQSRNSSSAQRYASINNF